VQHDAIAEVLAVLALFQDVQLHVPFRAARLEEHLVQVAAVDHSVRVAAEALGKHRAADRNADHFLARDRVHHDQMVRVHRIALDCAGKAQHFEHPVHVRAELDPGADLPEFGALLEHPHRNPFARKGERRGKPADAAAQHEQRSPAHAQSKFMISRRILRAGSPNASGRRRIFQTVEPPESFVFLTWRRSGTRLARGKVRSGVSRGPRPPNPVNPSRTYA